MLTPRAKYSPETQSVVDRGRDARLVPTAQCGRLTVSSLIATAFTRRVNTGVIRDQELGTSNQTHFFLGVKLVKLLNERKVFKVYVIRFVLPILNWKTVFERRGSVMVSTSALYAKVYVIYLYSIYYIGRQFLRGAEV